MSSVEEHLATRRAAGLFDFSFMAMHEFADIAALHRLQARDVQAMEPGQTPTACILDAGGAVIIDANVWRLDGALRHRVLEVGQAEGLRECGWESADSPRTEAGYVLFDREVDGEANPRELGLVRLVDGARPFEMRRRLTGLEFLEVAAGATLLTTAITSECLSPTLGKMLQ